MLPESRTPDEGFALPRFELTPRDVEGFLDELQTFHDHFRSCFSRSEPRGHFFNSMVGQFSALERTSIEPMALEVAGGNVRGMQRFIRDNIWDEDKMGLQPQVAVNVTCANGIKLVIKGFVYWH